MTYPPPSPIPVPPPSPVSPTTPANLGKVGFQLLLAATVITVLSEIGRSFAWRALAAGSAGVAENGQPLVSTVSFVVWGLTMLILAAAIGLGIAGLVRRERPMWWSIVAVASFVINPLIGLITGTILLSLL